MEGNFLLADQVKTDSIGSEMVVYHPNENIYILNETAKMILEAFLDGSSFLEIVKRVSDAYEVSSDIAEADIRDCLSALQEKAIIHPHARCDQ